MLYNNYYWCLGRYILKDPYYNTRFYGTCHDSQYCYRRYIIVNNENDSCVFRKKTTLTKEFSL